MHKKQLFVTREVTQTSDKDLEGVGTIREDDKGNVFRWVKFSEATNSTVSQYGAVCYDGDNRGEVKRPATATRPNMAGIVQAELTGGKYGWIQVKGKGNALVMRTGAATTDSIDSSAAFLSNYVISDAQYYLTQSNAIGFANAAFSPTSLASIASGTVAPGVKTLELVFSCRL